MSDERFVVQTYETFVSTYKGDQEVSPEAARELFKTLAMLATTPCAENMLEVGKDDFFLFIRGPNKGRGTANIMGPVETFEGFDIKGLVSTVHRLVRELAKFPNAQFTRSRNAKMAFYTLNIHGNFEQLSWCMTLDLAIPEDPANVLCDHGEAGQSYFCPFGCVCHLGQVRFRDLYKILVPIMDEMERCLDENASPVHIHVPDWPFDFAQKLRETRDIMVETWKKR